MNGNAFRVWAATHRLLAGAGGAALVAVTITFGVAVHHHSQDSAFLAAMDRNPEWTGFDRADEDVVVKFGRAVCGMYDDGKTGVEVFATLMNAVGDTTDPQGLPANQVSALMDVATQEYCPARQGGWSTHAAAPTLATTPTPASSPEETSTSSPEGAPDLLSDPVVTTPTTHTTTPTGFASTEIVSGWDDTQSEVRKAFKISAFRLTSTSDGGTKLAIWVTNRTGQRLSFSPDVAYTGDGGDYNFGAPTDCWTFAPHETDTLTLDG